MHDSDTIAALATPQGRGGIAIVRVSGERAQALLRALFQPCPQEIQSHLMMYGHIVYREQTLDECMAVLMRAPRSYTREDVVEFHLHGGAYVAQSVLDALFSLGARPAEAGEFTKRAFLNGRIDLSRAEAVMALINAQGERAARAAIKQLDGGVSVFAHDMQRRATDILAGITAALDFPDEIDEREAAGDVRQKARGLAEALERACDERGARLLTHGLDVALCGLPNVGKSSLLNALLRENRAIVTDLPGTTRDIVSGSMTLNGVPVHLSDTAGIRESAEPVEREGVSRARDAIRRADLSLLVLDAQRAPCQEERALFGTLPADARAVVVNKTDLHAADDAVMSAFDAPTFVVSTKTGEGLDALKAFIASRAALPRQDALTAARHIALARKAAQSLYAADAALQKNAPLDLAALDIQEALERLCEMTGDNVTDQLLDDVFSTFCIGK